MEIIIIASLIMSLSSCCTSIGTFMRINSKEKEMTNESKQMKIIDENIDKQRPDGSTEHISKHEVFLTDVEHTFAQKDAYIIRTGLPNDSAKQLAENAGKSSTTEYLNFACDLMSNHGKNLLTNNPITPATPPSPRKKTAPQIVTEEKSHEDSYNEHNLYKTTQHQQFYTNNSAIEDKEIFYHIVKGTPRLQTCPKSQSSSFKGYIEHRYILPEDPSSSYDGDSSYMMAMEQGSQEHVETSRNTACKQFLSNNEEIFYCPTQNAPKMEHCPKNQAPSMRDKIEHRHILIDEPSYYDDADSSYLNHLITESGAQGDVNEAFYIYHD